MLILLFVSALVAGLANPFQSGANAELNKHLEQPLWTAIFVYASGLGGLLLTQLLLRRSWPETASFGSTPTWAWFGGLVSLVPTIVALSIAQKLGAGVFTGASITASLVASMLLDQFGLLGFRQHTASPARIAGCGLMIAGVWLVARF